MSYVIRIQQFGGLKPSASPRALPDAAAQVAHNLDPSTAEFRPLDADTQVVSATGVSNPLTLHRFHHKADGSFNTDMTTGWVVKAADMSFVPSQINSDTTERTCASFNDGGTPSRVYDVNDMVTGRQLGVPAPTTKPTITVNVVDEFTVDERSSDITSAYAAVTQAIRDSLSVVWLGAADPGVSTVGYVNLQDAPYSPPRQAQQARVYRLSSTGGAFNGALSDTYSSVGVDAFSWVWDPQLHPFTATSNGSSPSWQGGSGKDHLCIGFYAYGKGYTVDQSGLATALAAIGQPGATAGEKLLTDDQINGEDGLVARMVNYTDASGPVKPKIDALAQKVAEIKTLFDGGTVAAAVAQMNAFYAESDVADLFTAAIANTAEAIYASAYNCFHSSAPQDAYQGN